MNNIKLQYLILLKYLVTLRTFFFPFFFTLSAYALLALEVLLNFE